MASKTVEVKKGKDVVITFEHEKDTKNMIRFSELPPSGDFADHLIGKLYLHKAAWDAIGQPLKMTVTVAPVK